MNLSDTNLSALLLEAFTQIRCLQKGTLPSEERKAVRIFEKFHKIGNFAKMNRIMKSHCILAVLSLMAPGLSFACGGVGAENL